MRDDGDEPPRAARDVPAGQCWAFLEHRTLAEERAAVPTQPSSVYRDLIEVISLLGAQVLYAQELGADNRSNAEIGEEILLAIKFPAIRRALGRLREAELDRVWDAPRSIRPAGGATVLKLRRRQ
jgi:hypothetical protein